MFELIRADQLTIMMFLCGCCGILILLLLITRFISESRKRILILMEFIALFLLWFDREAYIYAGDPSRKAFFMVRISNFLVFFLTSAIVFGFNLYLNDWLTHEGKLASSPKRLRTVRIISAMGMLLAVISAFTGLYYYFDETNTYHRGNGFLIAYIIPVVCPIVQYTVIRQYKKVFSKIIYISLVLYIFVPIACGILQIFMYGISIVNMAMVAVSVSLYIFTYIDINNTVEHAHEIELKGIQGENKQLLKALEQTAATFVSSIEKRDEYCKGTSVKIAGYARRIAELAGKDEDFCSRTYYSALFNDIGLIGISDSVIENESDPRIHEDEKMKRKPLIGEELLAGITAYPDLSQTARSSHEKYNGTGYPDGLKGEEIPEIARIVAVADGYVKMTTKKRYRDALPGFVAREEFIKCAGEEYDPVFSDIMVKIIDSETDAVSEVSELETDIACVSYRENITTGIPAEREVKRIKFRCRLDPQIVAGFSAPSIVLFDSFDRRVHTNDKAIKEYHYLEYGEVWFDDHMISTAARKMEITRLEKHERTGGTGDKEQEYEIVAGRYEDHLRLEMSCSEYTKELLIALPDSTKASYIGITGEHCVISGITVEPTGETVKEDDIPKIADPISYIDHMESDIKNIQIDRTRSASTAGIEIQNRMKIVFHTMSLPGAELVWHCPYIVIYYSDDGTIGGSNYIEYELIKLNGEDQGSGQFANNRFIMKKKDDFPGWNSWKETNKKGIECTVSLEKRGNRITLKTENVGISIECTTTVLNSPDKVYAALTGDQVALTDIRLWGG